MTDYHTPEEALDYLREHEVGSEEYEEATGYLYEFIENDVRLSSVDALHAVRHLFEGEVREAEDRIEELL